MKRPEISVVIPVFNAERTLPGCLDSLKNQDRQGVEVILIDDGSTDGSRQIMERSGFRVLMGGHQGPSAARNRGIAEAGGRLVAFTDSDCLVPPDWLSKLERALLAADATAAGGGQRSPEDETPRGRAYQRVMTQLGFVGDYTQDSPDLQEVRHNASCNVLYHKEALEGVGGFREDLYPGEDVDLDYRLEKQGCAFVHVPGVEVAHYRPQSLVGFARMMERYGWSQAFLVRVHGPFRFLHFLPLLTAAGALGLGTLVVVSPPAGAAVTLGALAAGYLALCLRSRALVRPDLAALVVGAWHVGFLRGLMEHFQNQGLVEDGQT